MLTHRAFGAASWHSFIEHHSREGKVLAEGLRPSTHGHDELQRGTANATRPDPRFSFDRRILPRQRGLLCLPIGFLAAAFCVLAYGSMTPAASTSIQQLVFVDAPVNDLDSLLSDISVEIETVMLKTGHDGIRQIGDVLDTMDEIILSVRRPTAMGPALFIRAFARDALQN